VLQAPDHEVALEHLLVRGLYPSPVITANHPESQELPVSENPRTKKQNQQQENDTHEVGERVAKATRREDKTKTAAIKGKAKAAQNEAKRRKK
jgi:hypothetical protein